MTVAYPKDNPAVIDYQPLIVRLSPVLNLTDAQLYDLAQLNRDLRIERSAVGWVRRLRRNPPSWNSGGPCPPYAY